MKNQIIFFISCICTCLSAFVYGHTVTVCEEHKLCFIIIYILHTFKNATFLVFNSLERKIFGQRAACNIMPGNYIFMFLY